MPPAQTAQLGDEINKRLSVIQADWELALVRCNDLYLLITIEETRCF